MKPGPTGKAKEDLLLVSFELKEGTKYLVEHFENKLRKYRKNRTPQSNSGKQHRTTPLNKLHFSLL